MHGSNLGHHPSNLSILKEALFEQALKQKDVNGGIRRAIPLRKERGSARLSFAQQRLWFLNQLEPESPNYNEAKALRIRGPLNVGALRAALDRVVARHEVLRTIIVSTGGTPLQVVTHARGLDVPLVDLRVRSDHGCEIEAKRILVETARRPFDLSRDLMLRALLLRLKDHEHVLLIVTHHIASDGWSSVILWRELAEFYHASASGQPSRLGELPIQYQDYAEWQRSWLQGEVLDVQLSYWRKQLEGVATLQLPTDRPPTSNGNSPGNTRSAVFPKQLSEELKLLSRKHGVTLFMTLLAAFQTLLQRYTGQDDIAVGSPIAGRNRVELESLIGFFVNTLVLRTSVSANPTFLELLGRVREVALGAYAHQDVPFEQLVEELQPERKLHQSPLFQTMFALQNLNREAVDLPGLTIDAVKMDIGTAKFDLALALYDEPDGLRTLIEYNTDLFDTATIDRMIAHFQTLLTGIVANPNRKISDLPILTDREKHQLLVEWNNTEQDYPIDQCIHELFEAQVEKSPDAVAVVLDNQRLTYRELNTQANRLAHYLKKLGVGPDVLVGICIERSLKMAVALLGILKAGGAYVPLDPAYPKERLGFMLTSAKLPIVITHSRLASALPPSETRVVRMDADRRAIDRESDKNPHSNVTAENLAYVIYTSGSTGAPKGVLIRHRSVVNHNLAVAHHFALSPMDRVAQCTTISFDVAVEELFPTWMIGATVVLCPRDAFFPNTDFLKWIAKERISVLDLPTAFWHDWVRDIELSRASLPETLRLVVVGGEKASADAFTAWQRITAERIRWVNGYGPTESTVGTIFYEPALHRADQEQLQEIPIGRPISNTRAYILDRHLKPIPVGVVGELYLGGDGLARGYLDRPELTADKFIADPFSDKPGTYLYRTGDLARYLPDGNIAFTGRRDAQIKLRGYRIELGEIEAALTQHTGVDSAVVVAREHGTGSQQLVAYVVLDQRTLPTTSELRVFLSQRLPEFMVPSIFISLNSLPLTPNGKIDRGALPDFDQSRPELEEAFVLPRTPVESLLAEIWAEVLEVKDIGIHDNFFELGGHSLKATQVISRIQQAFHVEIPLRSLFEQPTVAGLAGTITQSRSKEPEYLAAMLDELETFSADETRQLMTDE
jgi:amino acid adenylation domain-containing protein